MSLSDQTKDQFQLLVDLNEPEALLATMARMAARASRGLGIQGRNLSEAELKRWRNVASALIKAEAAVTALQSPERAKLEAHAAEWPPTWLDPYGESTGAGVDRPIPPSDAETAPEAPTAGQSS
jgi:hypothetical protein